MEYEPTKTLKFNQKVPVRILNGLAWLGALSFEERCVGSIKILSNENLPIKDVKILNYDTKTAEGDRRIANKKTFAEYLISFEIDKVLAAKKSAYTASSLRLSLPEIINKARNQKIQVVVDITCLTKIHTLILAEYLLPLLKKNLVNIAYTLPENYTALAENREDFDGFRQTIIVPLVNGAQLLNESYARGIIIPGHESQRLLVALTELEPSQGLIMRAITPSRPDFEYVTRKRNKKIIDQLKTYRKWNDKYIEFTAVREIWELIYREVEQCRRLKCALLIYPFGPKSVILSAALALASLYPEGTWFVYPVPSFYDPNYTEGTGDTYWISL